MARKLTKKQLSAIHAKKRNARKDGGSTPHHMSGGTPKISFFSIDDTLTNRELTPEEIDKIRTMIEWSGCMAFPQQCIIIRGVNRAYGLYKTKNKDRFQESVNSATSAIINPLIKNQIGIYSDPIFRIINDLEIKDRNSKIIEFDKNIFEDMIRGTISNLLM